MRQGTQNNPSCLDISHRNFESVDVSRGPEQNATSTMPFVNTERYQVMLDKVWRALSLLAVSVAVLFAFRDLFGHSTLGFPSASAVSSQHYAFYDHLWGAVRLLMLSVAATLAWWGPPRSHARTLAGAFIGLSLNNNFWIYDRNNPLFWPSVALNYLGIAFGLMQLLRFAASYGEGDWLHIRAISKRVAPYVGALIAIVGTLWWTSAWIWESPQPVFDDLLWYGWDAVNVVVIALSLVVVTNAKPDERTRTLCIAGSFLIGALGTAIHGATRAVEGDTAWASTLDSIAQAAMSLGLWYAILRQRAFDLNFVVNRLVALSIVGIFLGVLFDAVELLVEGFTGSATFGSSGSVQFSFQLFMTMLAVGSFRIVDNYTDKLLNRWRGRSGETGSREAALFAFAHDILDCRDSQTVVERLLQTLEVFGGVRAAAIYWRNSTDSFNSVASDFSNAPALVPADDPDVAALERSNEPRKITGQQRLPPSWCFPMIGRGTFRGFVLCDVGGASVEPTRADAIEVAVAGAATAMAAVAN